MKAIAVVIPFLLFASCKNIDTLFAPDEKSNVVQRTIEDHNALDRGPAVSSDLGPGQDNMLTKFVEVKEENKKLKLTQDELKATIEGLRQELSRSESGRLQERTGKLTAQAQLTAKDKDYRQSLARILDLQILRSRLQQKVYLLSLGSREREINNQLRAGQGLAPDGASSDPGRE